MDYFQIQLSSETDGKKINENRYRGRVIHWKLFESSKTFSDEFAKVCGQKDNGFCETFYIWSSNSNDPSTGYHGQINLNLSMFLCG